VGHGGPDERHRLGVGLVDVKWVPPVPDPPSRAVTARAVSTYLRTGTMAGTGLTIQPPS
jgi:hypothetical protein